MKLPPLPSPRLMAFDESIEIKGYNADDMRHYAAQAVAEYEQPWWRRLFALRTRPPLAMLPRGTVVTVNGGIDSRLPHDTVFNIKDSRGVPAAPKTVDAAQQQGNGGVER